MTLEQSHGKARPTLPRSGDLAAVPTAGERPRQRAGNGRFSAGNSVACGRGWRASIAKMVGRDLKGEVEPLARESWRMFRALLSELPHSGAQVSALVASRARSAVLSARFAAKAAEFGLDSPEGMKALDLSMKLDARAERLAVTAIDIATKLAASDRHKRVNPLHATILNAGDDDQ